MNTPATSELGLAVDKTSATRPARLTFTVQAPSGSAGSDAMLQLWNGMCWTTVAHKRIDGDGTTTLTYIATTAGDHRFGALISYGSSYALTSSRDLHVRVR